MAGDRHEPVRGGSSPNWRTRVLLLGPELGAVSGVSTHLNQLLGYCGAADLDLQHFVVGSEGRHETSTGKLLRLVISPLALAARIVLSRRQIVHINASFDHKSFPRDAVYLAVARLLRRKVVFQVHGGELPDSLYKHAFLREHFVRPVLKAATVVVLLAESERQAYSRFTPDVPLRVIANGIAINQQLALPEGVRSGPLRMAYVGRLVSTKGVEECIASAYLLRDSGRKFTLTIAGTGPQEDALKLAAKALIEQNLVEFVGAQFDEAKQELWRNSDLFLFPTTHKEGLPYSLLESMASGTVPITTRVGAQPDVMEDGVHGLFVPASDPQALFEAIVKLDDDRQLLLTMSQQSMIRIRLGYSIERLRADFGDLYRSFSPQIRGQTDSGTSDS